jgi:hypothetical protein
MGSLQPQILSCGVWSRTSTNGMWSQLVAGMAGKHNYRFVLTCNKNCKGKWTWFLAWSIPTKEHNPVEEGIHKQPLRWIDYAILKWTKRLKPHAWAQTCRRMWRNAKEFFHESWNRFSSRAGPGMSIMRSMVKDTCFYNFPKQAGLHLQKRNALLKHSMLGI